MKVFLCCFFVGAGLLASYGLGLKHGDKELRLDNDSLRNNLVKAECLVDKQWMLINNKSEVIEIYVKTLDEALDSLEKSILEKR